ncbi:septum site-determining protein MinC [Roseivivax sp. CAU 1761]
MTEQQDETSVQPQAESSRPAAGDVATPLAPLQIRGRFLTAIALHPAGAPDARFLRHLDARLAKMPQFFAGAPVVIDLATAGAEFGERDLAELVAALRQRQLDVFGVQNASPVQVEAARRAGLIPVAGGRDAPMPAAGPANTVRRTPGGAEEPAPRPRGRALLAAANRVITEPVRSGQSVVAERGDLTVIGTVSSGAELIASGSIHVYGRLRGRAMAGVEGDETARIFCHSLDAELLAIAGLYRTSESIGPELRLRPAHIHLDGERLTVSPLD